jgi:hypothetical protein
MIAFLLLKVIGAAVQDFSQQAGKAVTAALWVFKLQLCSV